MGSFCSEDLGTEAVGESGLAEAKENCQAPEYLAKKA
jgi:hypothetical protein